MSEYYAVVREGQDDHLEHLFGFGKKGGQKKNHKYVARVQVGSGWRYFYSTGELAAYKAGKVGSSIAGGAKKAAGAVDSKIGIGALIKKKKAGKAMKDATYNQAKNLGMAVAAVKDSGFKPGGSFENKLANTLKKDKRITERTYKEYDSAKKKYDKTLLGKISNSGVGKAVGGAAYKVTRAASEKAKKTSHDLGWDTYNYKKTEKNEDGSYTRTSAKLYRKRNKLAKLLGLPSLTPWKIDHNTVHTATGKKTENGNFQWSDRPHQRKAKVAKGTATVKKKKKVKSK